MAMPNQVTHLFHKKVAEFLFSDDPIFEMLKWFLSENMKAVSETQASTEKNSRARNERLTFHETERDTGIRRMTTYRPEYTKYWIMGKTCFLPACILGMESAFNK